MRVTTFIAGMAVGALAGMCLADRRTLTNLQSRIQLAGDVVTDVVGMAGGKVMDTAMTALSQVSALGGQSQQQAQGGAQQQAQAGGNQQQAQAGGNQQQAQAGSMQQAQAGGAQQQKTQQQSSQQDNVSLERIKELIARDPQLKRQVDAILQEAGSSSNAASQSANQTAGAAKSTTSTSSKPTSASSTTH
ncbi:hypothetical protein [Paenibacillus marinisediminis]